jgi:hypothetical protein
LRTDVLTTLLAAGARVTVLAPPDPALAAELGERGVALEALGDVDGLLARSPVRRAFTTLRYFILGDGHRAATLGVKARTALGELAEQRPLTARLVGLGVRPLWRSAALRRGLLALETALDRAHLHAGVLARVDPDIVVATTPGLFVADALVLREARRGGRRTAAVMLGWDNPTAKGYRGADVDLVIAWSARMAEQLTRHHDVPPDRIAVGGVPHFDRYLHRERLPGRDAVFAALGLDPERRTVVFTTPSPDLWGENAAVAETLAAAAEDGRLGAPAQVVVRLHPNFSLPRVRESAAPLAAVAARHPHVHLFTPELAPGALSLATSAADVDRLAGLLAHAAVLVNVFSTTTLEAFLVDTPVVALSEELAGAANSSRPGGPRSWDRFAHLQGLLRGEAARVARSLDELVAEVAGYLADPARDRAARRRVAEEECGPLDGRSGERVGRLLLAAACGEPPGGVSGGGAYRVSAWPTQTT